MIIIILEDDYITKNSFLKLLNYLCNKLPLFISKRLINVFILY